VKTRTATICFLLVGSLFAQTKGPSPVLLSKPQAAPDPTSSSGPVRIDAAKEADIRRLMDLAGVRQLVMQVMDGMEHNIKPLMMNALPPGEYRQRLVDLFFAKFHSKADLGQLVDFAVSVYDKYYTHEEIKGLIQFYESPLGQKLAATQPKMTGELQEAGRKWGEGLGRDSMIEVLSEHPELATALQAAKRATQPQ
jgi:uncharacterized protein